MKPDLADLKGELLAALGHPNRIRIVEFLKEGPKCACEIGPALNLEQSNLSRHAKVLLQAGVVYSWKDGQKVMYQVTDRNYFDILNKVSTILKNRVKSRIAILEEA